VGRRALCATRGGSLGRPCSSTRRPSNFVTTELLVGGLALQARYIPGHTLGAIAWYLPPRPDSRLQVTCSRATPCSRPAAEGCSRARRRRCTLSLQALVGLPPATRLWFGHEYTAANLRFAAAIEPDNAAVAARAADLPICTTPTTVALELATNPFVRADSAEQLAERRQAKDEFRG
jgi:hydroxyacylglutathione hydrolase